MASLLPFLRFRPRGVRFLSAFAGIDASKLVIERTTKPKEKLPNNKLAFGSSFTDHMLDIDWDEKNGWHSPKIIPYQPLNIDPAASVLHYALECFEGMKAFSGADGKVRLFRPDLNMKRLNSSAKRIFLPTFNGEEFTKCLEYLIDIERDWIPRERGFSLYIRPTMISTFPYLGVGQSKQAKLYVILSPVGPYYPTGFKPVKLYADEKFVRAWPGGSGNTKIGGNYAPTIMPQAEANTKGYQQIMWLFGEDSEISEVGTSNIFFFWINENGEKELITPPLDGTILPGVTRQSVLDLAREWNEFKVTERPIKMREFIKAVEEGRVIECFGSGTAVIVSPVEGFHYKGKDYLIPLDPSNPKAGAGKLTARMLNAIQDIQYGDRPHEWAPIVENRS